MRALMTLGFAILFGIVVYGLQLGPFAPKTAYALVLDRIAARIKADPEIRGAFESRLRQACSRIVLENVFCSEAYTEVGFDLARRGAARLDRESSARRMVLMSEFLATLDERSCAALVRTHGGGTANFRAAFERQPAERLQEWEDLAVKALTAELRGTPRVELGEQEIATAQAEMMKGLDSPTRSRILAMTIVKKDERSMSDADVCWLTRTVSRRVAELPEPSRSTMAMYLGRE